MSERDLQDYLYTNPQVLFPGQEVQEKTREYYIQGMRIDLLFVVEGVRYIVELKAVPITREHIGQVVEYYGLMHKYFQSANLRMILVAPSIPEWRSRYLEELGIRCVELQGVPSTQHAVDALAKESRAHVKRERRAVESDAAQQPIRGLRFAEMTGPITPQNLAIVKRIVEDSVPRLQTRFQGYEVVPYRLSRPHSHNFDVEPPASGGEPQITPPGVWWAFRFGAPGGDDTPPNDVPNVSMMGYLNGLDVALNAEVQKSSVIVCDRIRSATAEFNRLLRQTGGLWLKTYLKYEHQPKTFHWVLADREPPESFDGDAILAAYRDHGERLREEREHWVKWIEENNPALGPKRLEQLRARNKNLNLAIRLVRQFGEGDPFWSKSYDEQLATIIDATADMKPLLEFFLKGQ